MQLGLPQLSAHLQKGLRSLYTLHGDEPLLVQEAVDAIRASARAQGYTERTVHTVAGALGIALDAGRGPDRVGGFLRQQGLVAMQGVEAAQAFLQVLSLIHI